LIVDLPIEKIEPNPFNSRLSLSCEELDNLASSFKRHGQIVPVKVRPSPCREGKYELVFGYRRLFAAKKLGWDTIRAEVVSSASDQEIAIESLIENLERKDISDYEKAVIFERIKREFGLSFAEIGKMTGLSRQHISNYLGLLDLFDEKTLSDNRELKEAMFKITEHHSRILRRIEDQNTRMDLTLRTVKDGLSVKELSNIVGRLRSWFMTCESKDHPDEMSRESQTIIVSSPSEQHAIFKDSQVINSTSEYLDNDRGKISTVVRRIFELAEKRDYENYIRTRFFETGFTVFSAFPPLKKLAGKEAISREQLWFYEIAPRLTFRIQDLHVDVFDSVSLATFTVLCYNKNRPRSLVMKMAATLVLRKLKENWFVYHEHWSKFNPAMKDFIRTEKILTR
jgi:ParB/RepB/Spo0J family partition protein